MNTRTLHGVRRETLDIVAYRGSNDSLLKFIGYAAERSRRTIYVEGAGRGWLSDPLKARGFRVRSTGSRPCYYRVADMHI